MMLGFGPPELCCLALALVSGALYLRGLTRLWDRAGVDRGVSRAQAWLFVGGWCAAVLPAITGVHSLGNRVFSVHMIEHELLVLVAAPLFVLSRPAPVFAWSLPASLRRHLHAFTHARATRAIWQTLTDVKVAAALHALALWIWHAPSLFQLALADEAVHMAQHFSFLITALFFWWSVLSREARLRHPGLAAVSLFVTTVQTSLLGALLTFSRFDWYPAAAYVVPFCGLSRGEDQQLAGLIMWVPASLAYLAAALWLLGRQLNPAVRDDPRVA